MSHGFGTVHNGSGVFAVILRKLFDEIIEEQLFAFVIALMSEVSDVRVSGDVAIRINEGARTAANVAYLVELAVAGPKGTPYVAIEYADDRRLRIHGKPLAFGNLLRAYSEV